MWGSSLANVALFALIFPAVGFLQIPSPVSQTYASSQYIIMAIYARPLPVDPYNPSTSVGSRSAVDDVVRYPSPLIPIRIPVFALVIWLNDWIVRILSVGTSGGTPSSVYGGGGKHGARHRRVPSDSAESIEEGEVIERDGVSSRSGVPDAGRARVRTGGYVGSLGLGKGGRKYD